MKKQENTSVKNKTAKGIQKGRSKYEQKRQNKRKGRYSKNSPFILEPEPEF